MASFHDFKVNNLSGSEVDLSDYSGKVVLVVNTASECGFTPQFGQLEKLYETYKDQGFAIIGFPSNQFGGQEPLNGEAIGAFCTKNYGVTFDMMEKTVVKGKEQTDLYQFLSDKSINGNVSSTPKWNFHKYLIDKEGNVVDYFYSTTSPLAKRVTNLIEKLLAK